MAEEGRQQEKLSLEDFLAKQSAGNLLATIEIVPDDPDKVKVTPWIVNVGCLCAHSMIVDRDQIASVTTTGMTHPCCGKNLLVVEIEFKEGASLAASEVFGQLLKAASKKEGHGSESAVPALAMGRPQAFGGHVGPFGFQGFQAMHRRTFPMLMPSDVTCPPGATPCTGGCCYGCCCCDNYGNCSCKSNPMGYSCYNICD
jgi:hypothetical protein